MAGQDLEAPLLLLRVGCLVGEKLLLERVLVERLIGGGRVLEDNGDAVVPTAVFGCVVARLVHPDFEHPPYLDLLFQQWVVVLFKELEEFIGVAPLGFVVILDDERLAGIIGGSGLRRRRSGQDGGQQDRKGLARTAVSWWASKGDDCRMG